MSIEDIIEKAVERGIEKALEKRGLILADENLWNRGRVAQFLNKDNSTITRYINRGLLHPTGTKKKQLFKPAEVRALKSEPND